MTRSMMSRECRCGEGAFCEAEFSEDELKKDEKLEKQSRKRIEGEGAT